MTKKEIEKELLKVTMTYLEMEEKYDNEGDDVYEHMMTEDKMYNAKARMEELYKMLKELK